IEPWEVARMAVEFYNKDGKQVGGYPQAAAQAFGTTAWRPYKRMYPVPPEASSVKVQLALGNAKGTVYFDDIELLLTGEGGKALEASVWKAEPPKPSDFIRLNQMGFYPNGPKVAVVVTNKPSKFYVIGTAKKDTVFSGNLKKKGVWEPSGEEVSQADFSKVTRTGSYYLSVPGLADSHPFEIGRQVSHEMGK